MYSSNECWRSGIRAIFKATPWLGLVRVGYLVSGLRSGVGAIYPRLSANLHVVVLNTIHSLRERKIVPPEIGLNHGEGRIGSHSWSMAAVLSLLGVRVL